MSNISVSNFLNRRLKMLIKSIIERILNFRSSYYLNKVLKMKIGEKIRVGFIVQMPEVWDKEVRIYDELNAGPNVETVLIVVPPFDYKANTNSLSYENNFFIKKYPHALKAFNKDQGIIDIRGLHLDYVFFQRPYDRYLPPKLQSNIIVKYTRCCYVPYGYSGSDVFNGGNTNLAFFRNMSYVFLESEYMKFIFMNEFAHKIMFKYQHYETLGYPVLETYVDISKSITFKNIMWTPRWSYDAKIGGSHFLEYRELPFYLKEKYPEIGVVFRPHPLMFDELIKKGLMKQKDVEDYKKRIIESSITFDSGTVISDAIKYSDLLITDYSSIIINYFLTGKPIIYCKANYNLNEEYSKIEHCIYVAENEQQVKEYVEKILHGDDPLLDKRLCLIEQYKTQHLGAAKRIVDCLLASKESK